MYSLKLGENTYALVVVATNESRKEIGPFPRFLTHVIGVTVWVIAVGVLGHGQW